MLHAALAATTAWSAATTAPAASLYVDSTSGDDSNDGSAAHPFRTAQHCQNQATAGTTCVLRAGTYRESISINKISIAFRGDGDLEHLEARPAPFPTLESNRDLTVYALLDQLRGRRPAIAVEEVAKLASVPLHLLHAGHFVCQDEAATVIHSRVQLCR